MNDLLDFVIERHGGIESWYEASSLSATVHVHGAFWAFKGQPDRLGVESVRADIQARGRDSLALSFSHEVFHDIAAFTGFRR